MVGCYLGEPVDSEKCKAIAAIIERRLWALPKPVEQAQPEREPSIPTLEQIRAAIEDNLTCMYACTRVWEAWSVGTMSQDDFVHASETEFAEDTANAIRALFAAQQAQPERVGLTFWQVAKAFTDRKQPTQAVDVFRSGVRFAEKHHGTKGGQHD
jgi:hypothetical protein